MKIITIANKKGGVLKTTLSIEIASVLVKQNKKVLIVDYDTQRNVSLSFGIDAKKQDLTLYDLLQDDIKINEIYNLKELSLNPNLSI